MVCKPGGAQCETDEECCALLCAIGHCASQRPPPSGPPCPESAPAQGEGCLVNGVSCEYGESPVVVCDEVVTCHDWQWRVSSAPNSTDPACAPSATWCPTSLDDIPAGQVCAQPTIHCDFAGARCECAQNAPVAGWPGSWKCPTVPTFTVGVNLGFNFPNPGCPMDRPRLGSACSSFGLTCDYGACQIRGGNRQECVSVPGGPFGQGVWVDQPIHCDCPATLPDAFAPCTRVGLSCEFGSSHIAECDTTATCMGAGSTGGWMVNPGADGGPPCAPAPPSQCPAPGEPLEGLPCTMPSRDCDYADKRCECVTGPGAEPASTWRCADPSLAGTGCGPRPRLGTPCPQEGQRCDYGMCSISGGNTEACSGGVWNTAIAQCPLLCPRSPPAAGSPCGPLGVCEYGGSNVFQCDTIAVCWVNASPFLQLPPDGGPGPPPPPPPISFTQWLVSNRDAAPGPGANACGPLDASACPASFDAVNRDAACDGAPAFCDYPEGRCRCATAPDASAGWWSCQDPAPACPRPRPRLGTACAAEQEGLVCAYDPCDGVAGFAERCQQSLWVRLDVACGPDAGSASARVDAASD